MPDAFPSPERWHRIEAVFERAYARPPAERAAFLDEACAGDPALRREVESLLGSYEEASGYFGRLADEVVQPAFQEAGGLPAGTFVGPYEVVRLVGRGGMGEVYEARRGDGAFEQTVALKLVSRSGSAAVLRRFEAERQILAGLDHAHIARLLDGGLSGEGRPYFAMEFVRGEPITAYCDRRRLGVDARLGLFRTVCDAVQHAHRRLVVHRDLKPSNILVAETEDGRPVVKLLDFGIAKLLEADAGVSVLETQTGLRLMTPEYAAPEQVRGAAITTATDVYALGVLLYELLTGHRPYRLARRLPHEAERVILEEDPVRPSTAVTEAEDPPAAVTVSAARATEVARLRRRLAGDLDRICLMALRKEPDRRYGSATDLGEDVRRHLEGLPVAAQPDTVGYRARKFVRRHRAGVGAAAAVVLALVVGLGAALWQARVAAAERDRAAVEAETADAVAAFVTGLFAEADPDEARGDTLTVLAALDRGAARARAELTGQPDVRAAVLQTIGDVYRDRGDLDRADSLLSEAAALDATPTVRADAIEALGILRQSQGDYAATDSLYRAALDLRLAALGPDHPDVASSYSATGVLRRYQGDYAGAEAMYRRALDLQARLGIPDTSAHAFTLSNLGVALVRQNRFDEAEPVQLEALRLRRAVDGDTTLALATVYNNLGTLYTKTGDADEAERYLLAAIGLWRHILGADHPHVGIGLANLASMHIGDDRYDRARPFLEEALAVFEERYGAGHPEVSFTLVQMSTLERLDGDPALAAALARQALDDYAETLAPTHPYVGDAYLMLARALDAQERPEAADAYDRALAISEETLPPEHPRHYQTRIELARSLDRHGQQSRARELARWGLPRAEAAEDETYVTMARAVLGE